MNSSFFKSRPLKALICGIIALALILLIFWAGMSFGYQRALFATRYGQNYERNFGGGPMDSDTMNAHGAAGQIISVSGSVISVRGQNGVEQAILVGTTTIIEESRNTITLNDLKVNDFIVTIGEPNSAGQIDARLIRLLPSPQGMSSAPNATSTATTAPNDSLGQ